MDTVYVTSAEARLRLKVSTDTLRRWAKDSKISYIRSPGGNRLYNIEKFLLDKEGRKKVTYRKVENETLMHKDTDDLFYFDPIGSTDAWNLVLDLVWGGKIHELTVSSHDFNETALIYIRHITQRFGIRLTLIAPLVGGSWVPPEKPASGTKWTAAEEQNLLALVKGGSTIPQMAGIHKRDATGIHCKLITIGQHMVGNKVPLADAMAATGRNEAELQKLC
jgi:hypothetical protein